MELPDIPFEKFNFTTKGDRHRLREILLGFLLEHGVLHTETVCENPRLQQLIAEESAMVMLGELNTSYEDYIQNSSDDRSISKEDFEYVRDQIRPHVRTCPQCMKDIIEEMHRWDRWWNILNALHRTKNFTP